MVNMQGGVPRSGHKNLMLGAVSERFDAGGMTGQDRLSPG